MKFYLDSKMILDTFQEIYFWPILDPGTTRHAKKSVCTSPAEKHLQSILHVLQHLNEFTQPW